MSGETEMTGDKSQIQDSIINYLRITHEGPRRDRTVPGTVQVKSGKSYIVRSTMYGTGNGNKLAVRGNRRENVTMLYILLSLEY